ncbi:6-bladed beta-propeller [Chitinophaga sp.]|uniref:6-bladed beta-propeller n=1 Tax=Chitinophaga sp. TaxID=1869181 RepID=UPI002F92BFE5
MRFSVLVFAIPLLLAMTARAQEMTTLRIDPAAATGGTASQLIEDISFTTLESKNESIFGSIEQLIVTPEYYIILDTQTSAILLFDKSGKFHTKITSGMVKKEGHFYLYHINYDKFSRLIQIPGDKEIICYNTDGKFVKKIKTYGYGFDRLNIAKGKVAGHSYNVNKKHKDSLANEIVIIDEQGISKKHLPYNIKYAPIESNDVLGTGHGAFYATEDTAAFFVRPYDFKVYYLSDNSFYPAYQFVFPMSKTLPRDFLTDSTLNGKRVAYLEKNQAFYYNMDGIYRMGNNLFFRPVSFGYTDRKDGFIYNLASKHLIGLDKISPDERTHFLFVTDTKLGGWDFISHNFLTTDSTSFYTSYSSLALFQQKEALKDKKLVYPPVLAAYFQDSKNKRGNPVIIRVTFKKEM